MAALVSLDKAKSHVISILQASRTAYATTVDSSKRQFASDTEIADSILEADGEVCQAIITTPGHQFSSNFVVLTAALQNSAQISVSAAPTSSVGRILKVTHSLTSGGTYTDAIPAKSKEEVLEMRDFQSVYTGTATYVLDFYYIDDWTLYIADAFAKVTMTDYTRTAAPQAPETYIWAVVSGAISKLLKDGGDTELHADHLGQFRQWIADIKGGVV